MNTGQHSFNQPPDTETYSANPDNYYSGDTYQQDYVPYQQQDMYQQQDQYGQESYGQQGYDNYSYEPGYDQYGSSNYVDYSNNYDGGYADYSQTTPQQSFSQQTTPQQPYRAPHSTGTPRAGGYGDAGLVAPTVENRDSDSLTVHELADIIHRCSPGRDCFDAIVEVLNHSQQVETLSVREAAQAWNHHQPPQTTLMLRNVPTQYTQHEFLQEINNMGMAGFVDFLYMPPNHRQQAPEHRRTQGNAGLTFINFVSTDVAQRFKEIFGEGQGLVHFPAESPITVIPSTTQGWRANVLKVVRNCIMRRRRIHPDELPLLFCKQTGELIPFPVPNRAYSRGPSRNPSLAGSDHGDRRGKQFLPQGERSYSPPRSLRPVPVSLVNEFDDEDRGSNYSASGASSRGKKSGESDGNKSWQSQKSAVEQDPLEALAPNATGCDAVTPEIQAQRDEAERQVSYSAFSNYGGADSFPWAKHYSFGNRGGLRTNAGMVGRFSRATSAIDEHIYEPVLKESNVPTKACDFFQYHGLSHYGQDHLMHINSIKKMSNCSEKMKAKLNKNKLFVPMPAKTQSDPPSPPTGPKSPSSLAAAQALKNAILGKALPKIKELEKKQEQNAHAAAFCDINVDDMAEKRLSHRVKVRGSSSSCGSEGASPAASSDSFNTKIFQNEDTIPDKSCSKDSIQAMWSSASNSLSQMLERIKAGTPDEDETQQVARSRSRLFGRSMSKISVPTIHEESSIPVILEDK